MEIEKKHWEIWDNITFKTTAYHKNFDLVNDNESIISEYCGTISQIRLAESKPPLLIGEFELSVWNIALGRIFDVNFNKLLKNHKVEAVYGELLKVVKEKHVDITQYDRLVLIANLVVRPDYRKSGITEEFVELMYREYYGDKNAIITLVKPLQDNAIDADYYFKQKVVEVRNSLKANYEIEFVPAVEYYSLNDLYEKQDTEINEYKLFSVASKCGFSRIDDSNLFLFSPEITVKRMIEKQEYTKKMNALFKF
jgi:hypothetical protein